MRQIDPSEFRAPKMFADREYVCPICGGGYRGESFGRPIKILFPPVFEDGQWTRRAYACANRIRPWRREDQQANPYQLVPCGEAMAVPDKRRTALPYITEYRDQVDQDRGIVITADRVRMSDHYQMLKLWREVQDKISMAEKQSETIINRDAP